MVSKEDECTRSDDNSECDDTNTCICRANYVEEFAVCKGEYMYIMINGINSKFPVS